MGAGHRAQTPSTPKKGDMSYSANFAAKAAGGRHTAAAIIQAPSF